MWGKLNQKVRLEFNSPLDIDSGPEESMFNSIHSIQIPKMPLSRYRACVVRFTQHVTFTSSSFLFLVLALHHHTHTHADISYKRSYYHSKIQTRYDGGLVVFTPNPLLYVFVKDRVMLIVICLSIQPLWGTIGLIINLWNHSEPCRDPVMWVRIVVQDHSYCYTVSFVIS